MTKHLASRIIFAALAVVFAGGIYWLTQNPTRAVLNYEPPFRAEDFVPELTNKYFKLVPGTKFTFVKRTSGGIEKSEIAVLKETKTILGVKAVVVWDRVWENGKLKEDTRDLYAQDKQGNVWYFGEAVANYVDGKLDNYAGTWEAGVGGAKPGVIMPAEPKVGLTYRQEFAKGKAEDMGTIVAVGISVKVPHGSFDDCVKTRDWSLLEWTANEFKYYCAGVGFITLEESGWFGASLVRSPQTELVAVTRE